MERFLFDDLNIWKNDPERKPLILQGARQVGKTWLMKEFGKNEFELVVYLNFESSLRIKNLFIEDFDVKRIISTIEVENKVVIHPATTLLIFDEIQEAEAGLTALKYFYENAPEYYVIAAGSLLGVAMQKKHTFPVGKVDFLQLFPLSFSEFLINVGEKELENHLKNHNWNVIASFHEKLVALLRVYYFTGGMPEVVANYIKNKDFTAVRNIQNKIILGYENDFAKYAPNDIIPKIRLIWHSIISQLAKENRKFIYGQLKKGARAKEFENAIQWLVDAGLVLKVNLVEKPAMPLVAYVDFESFKLFFVDIGLLNAIAGLNPKIVLEKNTILTEYKGALTEQFVCQQLRLKHNLNYWTASNATAEIDFVIQSENEIVPIEVKAEENLKAKSLKTYIEKYEPKKALRCSMSKYREDIWLTNIPLYGINYV